MTARPSPDLAAISARHPDLESLETLAREAVSVGWYDAAFFRAFIDDDGAEVFSSADADYFAAVSPQTVLSLLDRLRGLRQAAEDAADWLEAEADHSRPDPRPAMRLQAGLLRDALRARGATEAQVAETATPDLRVALADGDRRVQRYANQQEAAAERKDWAMADRWRYLATGNAEAIEAIRAALRATPATATEGPGGLRERAEALAESGESLFPPLPEVPAGAWEERLADWPDQTSRADTPEAAGDVEGLRTALAKAWRAGFEAGGDRPVGYWSVARIDDAARSHAARAAAALVAPTPDDGPPNDQEDPGT